MYMEASDLFENRVRTNRTKICFGIYFFPLVVYLNPCSFFLFFLKKGGESMSIYFVGWASFCKICLALVIFDQSPDDTWMTDYDKSTKIVRYQFLCEHIASICRHLSINIPTHNNRVRHVTYSNSTQTLSGCHCLSWSVASAPLVSVYCEENVNDLT